jgi:hypothetical protein
MILTLQCTARCRACGHQTTPINGAVENTPCRRCGAQVTIPGSLWAAAFDGLVYASEELPENGAGHEEFAAGGNTLRVGFLRVPPACPHCSSELPPIPGPGQWFGCPFCGIEIPRRDAPFATDESITLIAEARDLTGNEGAMLRCRNCGAPLPTGTGRRTQCDSCQTESVVPDEIYRRLNAPDLAARWMVQLPEVTAPHPLAGVSANKMAVSFDNILYMTGSTPTLEQALLAFDPVNKKLLWAIDVGVIETCPIPIPVGPQQVALVGELESTVYFATPDGVRPGFRTEVQVQDATYHRGQLMMATFPMHELARYSLAGARSPAWGGRGGGDSDSLIHHRPSAIMGGLLGYGHDGDLRLIRGSYLARYDDRGNVLWSQQIADAVTGGSAPTASADGTTYAVVWLQNGSYRVVRYRPDGSFGGVVLEADHITAIAAQANGCLWLMAGNHEDGVGTPFTIQCLDPNGFLIWKGPTGI